MWPAVDLREIRVFLTVAEELHFGRAADRLDITHSRASQIIRTLETRVGGRLFDRTSRRVRLTPIGEQLRAGIEPAYDEFLRAFDATREAATGIAGVIRVGMYTPVNGGPHMLEIINTFESRYPDCTVELVDTGLARPQLDWLHRQEADILAMRLPLNAPEVAIGPILSHEQRFIAVAHDHPLADQESICVEDLADYTLPDVVSLPREMMDAFVPRRTPAGKLLRRVEINSPSEAIMRVATGEYVHLTVPSFFAYHPHPGVVAIPVRDLPPSQTALLWLKTNQSAKVMALVRAAGDVLRGYELPPTGKSTPTSPAQ